MRVPSMISDQGRRRSLMRYYLGVALFDKRRTAKARISVVLDICSLFDLIPEGHGVRFLGIEIEIA